MAFTTIFGIFVVLLGIIITILNVIIVIKINNKDVCKNDDTLKNTNTGNLVLGITLLVIGIIFYIYGKVYHEDNNKFGFG